MQTNKIAKYNNNYQKKYLKKYDSKMQEITTWTCASSHRDKGEITSLYIRGETTIVLTI